MGQGCCPDLLSYFKIRMRRLGTPGKLVNYNQLSLGTEVFILIGQKKDIETSCKKVGIEDVMEALMRNSFNNDIFWQLNAWSC